MKELIKKYKFLIIFVLVVCMIITVFFIRKESTTPLPTPPPVIFELEQSFPPQGTYELVIPNFAIHFIFTKPFNVASTAIKIEPFTDFEISTDDAGTTLFVMPVPKWKFNTEYKITVSTKSKDGDILETPIEYQFQPIPLTTSELEQIPL